MTHYCLERLGDVQKWNAMYWTYTWPTVYLVYASKARQKRAICQGLQFLGDVVLANGDQNTAVSLFTVALEGFTQMDIHRS